MNYYIQGDAANADKIKAAFEKLGYDTTGHLFNAKSVLYFTLDGGIMATTCNCTPAIIKTHPDYKELELPVEPKFKKGDWIIDKHLSSQVFYVSKVLDYTYEIIDQDGDDYHVLHYKVEEDFRLLTIADAKDGDVLVTTKIRSCPFIYRKTNYNNNLAYYYAGINGNGDFCEGCLKRTLYHFGSVSDVIPATKEQRDLLFAKMKEAGYEWDANKKKLRKIKPHYDISNFNPFDKVLVRQDDSCTWGVSFFGRYAGIFICCSNVCFTQCIPFDGNEHLLGTTDMCDKQYINW